MLRARRGKRRQASQKERVQLSADVLQRLGGDVVVCGEKVRRVFSNSIFPGERQMLNDLGLLLLRATIGGLLTDLCDYYNTVVEPQ